MIDTKHNIKVLWKTINGITHYKKRSNNSISNLVNEIGENIVDPNAMADMFNTYFYEIGKNMASDIEDLNCTHEFSCI